MIGKLLKRRASTGEAGSIVVEGARKATGGKGRTRIVMTMAVFFGIFSIISGRLVYLGFQTPDMSGGPQSRVTASRPDIVDRNGRLLATDLEAPSIYADPGIVVDRDELVLYDGQQEVVAALEAGRIEATLLDLPLAVAIAERSGGKLEAVAQLPDKEALAVALPQGSPNRQAVDSAIRALTADGTIEDLLEEWIGAEAANAESEIPLLHTTLH